MDKYVTLLGTEDVNRAASRMAEAADTMMRAASYMDDVVTRQRMMLDEALNRFEELLRNASSTTRHST